VGFLGGFFWVDFLLPTLPAAAVGPVQRPCPRFPPWLLKRFIALKLGQSIDLTYYVSTYQLRGVSPTDLRDTIAAIYNSPGIVKETHIYVFKKSDSFFRFKRG
jgi:hypothetical protein